MFYDFYFIIDRLISFKNTNPNSNFQNPLVEIKGESFPNLLKTKGENEIVLKNFENPKSSQHFECIIF